MGLISKRNGEKLSSSIGKKAKLKAVYREPWVDKVVLRKSKKHQVWQKEKYERQTGKMITEATQGVNMTVAAKKGPYVELNLVY